MRCLVFETGYENRLGWFQTCYKADNDLQLLIPPFSFSFKTKILISSTDFRLFQSPSISFVVFIRTFLLLKPEVFSFSQNYVLPGLLWNFFHTLHEYQCLKLRSLPCLLGTVGPLVWSNKYCDFCLYFETGFLQACLKLGRPAALGHVLNSVAVCTVHRVSLTFIKFPYIFNWHCLAVILFQVINFTEAPKTKEGVSRINITDSRKHNVNYLALVGYLDFLLFTSLLIGL